MKKINKYIATALMTAGILPAQAQQFATGTYADGYLYKYEVNPAMHGDSKFRSFAIGNINVNTQGSIGLGDFLFENPNKKAGAKSLVTFMHPDIDTKTALAGFKSGDNTITGEVKMDIFAQGFKGFGGYNVISLGLRNNVRASVPYGLLEFAKEIGQNTYNIGDINLRVESYAQLGITHSHDINEKLRVGVTAKLLMGLARVDFDMKDMRAELGDKKWTVSGASSLNISAKMIELEKETKDYEGDGAGQYEAISDINTGSFGPAGFGFGLDLGAVYKVNEDLSVNAAILDLGFMKWNSNITAKRLGDKFEFEGFHDIAIKGDDTVFEGQKDGYANQLIDFAHLEEVEGSSSRTTSLGTTINVGAEYTLPVYRRVKFGALATSRLQGQYSWTEGRLSANYNPLKWIDISVSGAAGTYGMSAGWLLSIHPKGFNIYAGMDRMIGKVSKQGIPLGSNANFTMGLSLGF